MNFDFGDEAVTFDGGCGITLRGQMWYFGGTSAPCCTQQVSSKAILKIKIIYSREN